MVKYLYKLLIVLLCITLVISSLPSSGFALRPPASGLSADGNVSVEKSIPEKDATPSPKLTPGEHKRLNRQYFSYPLALVIGVIVISAILLSLGLTVGGIIAGIIGISVILGVQVLTKKTIRLPALFSAMRKSIIASLMVLVSAALISLSAIIGQIPDGKTADLRLPVVTTESQSPNYGPETLKNRDEKERTAIDSFYDFLENLAPETIQTGFNESFEFTNQNAVERERVISALIDNIWDAYKRGEIQLDEYITKREESPEAVEIAKTLLLIQLTRPHIFEDLKNSNTLILLVEEYSPLASTEGSRARGVMGQPIVKMRAGVKGIVAKSSFLVHESVHVKNLPGNIWEFAIKSHTLELVRLFFGRMNEEKDAFKKQEEFITQFGIQTPEVDDIFLIKNYTDTIMGLMFKHFIGLLFFRILPLFILFILFKKRIARTLKSVILSLAEREEKKDELNRRRASIRERSSSRSVRSELITTKDLIDDLTTGHGLPPDRGVNLPSFILTNRGFNARKQHEIIENILKAA